MIIKKVNNKQTKLMSVFFSYWRGGLYTGEGEGEGEGTLHEGLRHFRILTISDLFLFFPQGLSLTVTLTRNKREQWGRLSLVHLVLPLISSLVRRVRARRSRWWRPLNRSVFHLPFLGVKNLFVTKRTFCSVMFVLSLEEAL